MKNHKLVLTLKTLSKKELNAFVRLVNTTYFNRKEEVVLLVEYLKKQYPKFSENLIKKEKIFKVISKEKTYNKRFLDDTVYHTIKLLEQFLVMEHLNDDSFGSSKILMKELKKRKLTDLALKELEKSKKLLSKSKLDLESDFEHFSLQLNEYLLRENTFKEEDILPLTIANKSLEKFYWKNKLWFNDELKSRSETNDNISSVLNISELEKCSKEIKEDVIVNIFLFINLVESKYSFEEIFEKFKLINNSISPYLQYIILVGLTNYSKKQYAKTQDMVYTKYWFDLYKFGYENDIYLNNNKVNDTSFLNIVHLGLVHKEYNWVEFFIEDYKKHLTDKMLFNLSKAMYNFELKNYTKVINELLAVQFGHIYQNLTARSLLAKTYFEMKEYDLLDAHLKAYDIYLRRQIDISEQLRQVNLNFVSAVKKLALAQFDKKAMASLQKDLKEKPIAYKSWFNQFLQE